MMTPLDHHLTLPILFPSANKQRNSYRKNSYSWLFSQFQKQTCKCRFNSHFLQNITEPYNESFVCWASDNKRSMSLTCTKYRRLKDIGRCLITKYWRYFVLDAKYVVTPWTLHCQTIPGAGKIKFWPFRSSKHKHVL